MSRFETYYDYYEVGEDSDGNPIYDSSAISHTQLVGRARAETGKQHVVSIDWYDTWQDGEIQRVRAKVVMG